MKNTDKNNDVRFVHPIVWVSSSGRFRLFPSGTLEMFDKNIWSEIKDNSVIEDSINKIRYIKEE